MRTEEVGGGVKDFFFCLGSKACHWDIRRAREKTTCTDVGPVHVHVDLPMFVL